MFRNLGTFAPLALCLFAIVIAMGSCGPPKNTNSQTKPLGTEDFATAWADTKEHMGSNPAAENQLAGRYTARIETSNLSLDGSLTLSTRGYFLLEWSGGQSAASSREGDWTAGSMYLILDDVRYKYDFQKSASQSKLRISKMPTPGGRQTVEWKKQ